jgi:hypothetical protein
MSLSQSQLRSMYVADTVPVPVTFPELGDISVQSGAMPPPGCADESARSVVRVEQNISPKLMIARSFPIEEVSAVFLPDDLVDVDLSQGTWLLGPEIESALLARSKKNGAIRGITYVREHARTLMQVEMGMTAAESVEYYPPLVGDRSADHYQFPTQEQQQQTTPKCGGVPRCGTVACGE